MTKALLGALAATAFVLAPACRNASEENKSKDVVEKIGDKAKEVGDKVADGAKDVAGKVEKAAKELGSDALATKQTADVRAALMLDASIDSSHIDVSTDAGTKTVTLKGSVPSAAQRTATGKLAKDRAEGYKVSNQLTVARR